MEEYVELAKNEIEKAIQKYEKHKPTPEWRTAEEEFKKISRKVEELIYGDGNIHTDKVSHQAIRFFCDIPNNWEVLENILCGFNTEKILPCVLFTWLLNMNEKLWGRLKGRMKRNCTTFKDKRIASLLAKSQSKTPNANNEIKITDLFFYNVSEIPNDYDLAFMMVIRFLTLFNLSICAKADKSACMTWFENKYGILRHIFTYDENKDKTTRGYTLDYIMYGLSRQKTEEKSLVEYFKEFNKHTQTIKDKIMVLDFSNKDIIENKIYDLINDIRNLGFLTFRYELFKSNYTLNRPLSNIADSLAQMCQCFDADIHIEKLTVKNSKNNNSQSDINLKEVAAKIESISKLQLIKKPSRNDDNNCNPRFITVYDYKDTTNYYNKEPYVDFSKLEERYIPKSIHEINMLYSSHDFILKGTLKILSAKCKLCKAEFTLSCDKLKVDNAHIAHMINTQFNFKANSKVFKSNDKKDKWYNSIFLLLANEI